MASLPNSETRRKHWYYSIGKKQTLSRNAITRPVYVRRTRTGFDKKSGIHCLPGLFVYKTRDKEVGGYKALHKARQGKLKPELKRVAGFWSPEFVLD